METVEIYTAKEYLVSNLQTEYYFCFAKPGVNDIDRDLVLFLNLPAYNSEQGFISHPTHLNDFKRSMNVQIK